MRKTVLLEGIFLLIIGFGSCIEALRLTIYKDPRTLYDPVGPGPYLLVLSLCLIATGSYHIYAHRKERGLGMKIPREHRIRLLAIVGVIALYIFSLHFLGYLIPTIIFFLLEFRIAGVKSWKLNIIISIIVSVCYDLVFIQYCSMVFPRGIFGF